MRLLLLLILTAVLLSAATFKLYLKDGDYHSVREYQVQGDHVRYYSTERGDWEEIPVELCDLAKTERERKAITEDSEKQAKLIDAEEKLERDQRKEVERIPMNPGAYHVENDRVNELKYADLNLVKDKRRSVLQKVTPIPIVSGKATLEVKGDHSAFLVHDDEPEFYMRLEGENRFLLVQLTPKKGGGRIVENVDIAPITNESFENPRQIPAFQKEMTSGLYKVWPEKPLTPGEYALIERTGEDLDLRVWDFAYRPDPTRRTP